MIKAGQIDKGMFLLIKNEPHLVVEREFVSPGKGSAFVRLKLKNLKTGMNLRPTMKTQEEVEEANVVEKPAQYLYVDDDGFVFMDQETFEQFHISREVMEDRKYFIREGETFKVMLWDDNPIDIVIPTKMVFTIIEAEEAIKGDTVTGSMKNATIETGLKVRVPLFIKTNEKIMVNTDTKEYVERVNS
jgi:elongation factor P